MGSLTCKTKSNAPSAEAINAIDMKRGEIVMCGSEGKNFGDAATIRMIEASSMEDLTQKHPVTPGEVFPTRELLGDMWLEWNYEDEALRAYELNINLRPNRFNSLFGAALASEKSGKWDKAVSYYKQLLSIAEPTSSRPEIAKAKSFIEKHDAM